MEKHDQIVKMSVAGTNNLIEGEFFLYLCLFVPVLIQKGKFINMSKIMIIKKLLNRSSE